MKIERTKDREKRVDSSQHNGHKWNFRTHKTETGTARTNDNNKKWIAFSEAKMKKHTRRVSARARALTHTEKKSKSGRKSSVKKF